MTFPANFATVERGPVPSSPFNWQRPSTPAAKPAGIKKPDLAPRRMHHYSKAKA